MNSKQLAEMIKNLRKLKQEQLGGMGKFKGGAVDLQDMSSPNRKVGSSSKEQHHVSEAKVPINKGGTQGKSTLGNFETRFGGQRARGLQMRRPSSYTAESEENLGKTMTGKNTKKRTETVNKEPEIKDHIF